MKEDEIFTRTEEILIPLLKENGNIEFVLRKNTYKYQGGFMKHILFWIMKETPDNPTWTICIDEALGNFVITLSTLETSMTRSVSIDFLEKTSEVKIFEWVKEQWILFKSRERSGENEIFNKNDNG